MWIVRESQLKGTIRIPSSKSQSIRALVFALLAHGESMIHHLLPSPDVDAMLRACVQLGAKIKSHGDHVIIQGLGGKIRGAEDVIQAGNSGLVFRFIGALAGLSLLPIVITGDASIRHVRPIQPLLNALQQLGVQAISLRGDGGGPILVQGPIKSALAVMEGQDSQPVSGMLIASAFAEGPIELYVTHPGEKPWVQLTLHWLDRLGIRYIARDFEYYRLEGGASIEGFEYQVPADFSSLTFPLVAALLTGSEIEIDNLDFSDHQGDKKVITYLEHMGAQIEIEKRKVRVKKGGTLEGGVFDINDCIDALPILAVVGCFATGVTKLTGAAIARKKESDRIRTIAQELQKMGGKIEESSDGLTIWPTGLCGAVVNSHQDHRIALALAVAGCVAKGETCIQETGCAVKSYPNFLEQMQHLGANIVEREIC